MDNNEMTVVNAEKETALVSDNVWTNKEQFNQMLRSAQMLSQTSIIPQSYQGKPQDCFVAIEMASRIGVSPMMVTGKLIHLCFTCDPYPTGYDTTPTREIIRAIKESGNNVQILTKGDGSRDFDLLDENDWYGITLDGVCDGRDRLWEERIDSLMKAHERGIKTWISFEPVTDETMFLIELSAAIWADKVKIGKLNYHKSDINWAEFGRNAEKLCKERGIDYYIKESLRAEMER